MARGYSASEEKSGNSHPDLSDSKIHALPYWLGKSSTQGSFGMSSLLNDLERYEEDRGSLEDQTQSISEKVSPSSQEPNQCC